jgi:trimethylamine--corrinoid protein Co-methyltransferase
VVGAGLLGSAMILSLEQMLIDTEIFRMCKQARRGIVSNNEKWLDEVIDHVGPGGHFLDHPTTTSAVRSNEWYFNQLGVNTTLEEWVAAGRPDVSKEAREMVDRILSTHQPLPLDEDIDRELERIRTKAAERFF